MRDRRGFLLSDEGVPGKVASGSGGRGKGEEGGGGSGGQGRRGEGGEEGGGWQDDASQKQLLFDKPGRATHPEVMRATHQSPKPTP